MTRPLVSVVMATYNRGHLLARSLACYERCAGLDVKRDLELIVVDDSSTDGTDFLVRTWSKTTGIKAVVLTPYPKTESWRDCGAVLNYGLRASTGKHVLLTHPEVMPGRKSVAECVDVLQAQEKCWGAEQRLFGPYACCKVYYLSPRDQERLDTVPWRSEGNLAVRQIEGFYTEDGNGHPDFTHKATDGIGKPGYRLSTWESFVFGGHSRATWKNLGGMLETQKWGSVDVAWMHRRRTLGIPNQTCHYNETIVIHQNHNGPNDVLTDRNMENWVKELERYPLSDASKMVYPEVDNL